MSRIIYNTVNKEYNKYKSNKNYSINIITATYKLLLDIIDDKNDDEINDFITSFQLKRCYFARLFNPFKECNFNSFDNINDLINKTYQIDDEDYYLELNIFLTEKLKKE